MGHWQRWIVGGLGVALVLAALGVQGPVSAADPIYVDAEATGDNDGSTWEHAFTDLQSALEVAGTGNQIWVAEGIYRPTEAHGGTEDRYKSFQLKNNVAIYGGFDPTVGDTEWEQRDWEANATILSGDIGIESDAADNSYHVIYHPASLLLDSSAILDGFIITSGNANGSPAHQRGGGMYNNGSSPTINHCTFLANSAATGGGMYNDDCAPALINCTFEGNSASYGAGMGNYYSSPELTGCTFTGNSADYGGAMDNYYYSSPELTGCTFTGNSANYDGGGVHNDYNSSPSLTGCTFTSNSAGRYGGGMYNDASSPVLSGCAFADNSANIEGGGMFNDDSAPVLTGCAFADNTAGQYGGGMQNTYSTAPVLTNCTFKGNNAEIGGGAMHNYSSSPVLANCTFTGNSTAGVGGGMRNSYYSSPTLTNCTFSGNSAPDRGGGLYNRSSSPVLTNCILWGDTPDEIYDYEGEDGPGVTYSDIQGGYEGESNIVANPFFVDLGDGALRLGACSPCIDAGNNGAPALPDLDFEGDARILDGDGSGIATVDMGVDEVAVPGTCFRTRLPAVFKGY